MSTSPENAIVTVRAGGIVEVVEVVDVDVDDVVGAAEVGGVGEVLTVGAALPADALQADTAAAMTTAHTRPITLRVAAPRTTSH